jgi:hypothetical protein
MTKTRKVSPHAWLFFTGVGLFNFLTGIGIVWFGAEESAPQWPFSATALAWTLIFVGAAGLGIGIYLRLTRSSYEHDYEFNRERRQAAIVATVGLGVVIALFAVAWVL